MGDVQKNRNSVESSRHPNTEPTIAPMRTAFDEEVDEALTGAPVGELERNALGGTTSGLIGRVVGRDGRSVGTIEGTIEGSILGSAEGTTEGRTVGTSDGGVVGS